MPEAWKQRLNSRVTRTGCQVLPIAPQQTVPSIDCVLTHTGPQSTHVSQACQTMPRKLFKLRFAKSKGKNSHPFQRRAALPTQLEEGRRSNRLQSYHPPPTLPLPPNPSAGCYYSSSRGKSEEATVSCQELCIQESPRQLRDVRERVSTVLPAAQPSSLQRLMVTGDAC